jgi:beta-lactamase superfamily II metal-dependent hydrolase
LLKEQDVKEFYNHYKNYWDDYWLFQIPHHGSQNNSNGILHSQISSFSTNFINYGIGNRDNHPNSSVIKSLIITGNSTKLIPINQFQGIRFNLVLHSYQ